MPNYFGADRTAAHVLRHQVEADPDRTWIVDGDRKFTVRDMNERSDAVAWGLSSHGVKPESPVLLMMPNGVEFLDCWLALVKLNSFQVPVNTAYFGQMLSHIVRDSGARHLVVHTQFASSIASIDEDLKNQLETIVLVGSPLTEPILLGSKHIAYEELLKAQFKDGAIHLPEHSKVAAIMYTSGTTGASKGVMVSHAHSYQYAAGDNALELSKVDVYYAPLPLFHIAGQWAVVYSCLIRGATAVIKQKFSITDFWSDVDNYGVTTTFMLGAMGSMLHRTTPEKKHTSLRKVLMSPLIPDYLEFCEKFGVRVATSYASTEVNGVIATDLNPPNSSTCGRVRADKFEVMLVDANDEEVSIGEVGELVVRPKIPWIVMAGYWKRPEATLEAWRNLWLHSGDLLKRDEAGYYYFVDRSKDSIRRRGENISSVEVEAAVNAIPGVLESAVIPVKSEMTEQEVLACIVFKEGLTLEMREVHTQLAAVLPKFMVPRYLKVIEAVPKTPTGKPQKFKLREDTEISSAWDALARDN